MSDFIADYWSRQSTTVSAQHYTMNISLDFDSESGHGETYFLAVIVQTNQSVQLTGGRYVDRYERRDGIWKIATRVVVREWGLAGIREATERLIGAVVGRRDPSDVSYMRPLQISNVFREE